MFANIWQELKAAWLELRILFWGIVRPQGTTVSRRDAMQRFSQQQRPQRTRTVEDHKHRVHGPGGKRR